MRRIDVTSHTSPFLLLKIGFFGMVWKLICFYFARVAQLVEHSTDTRGVPGSNPGTRTKFYFAKMWARCIILL